MLKAIAIDDEAIGLEIIKTFSAKIPFLQLAACFTDPFEAITYLQKEKVDLLFLDIKMPDISGIDLLQSLPVKPMVIFTTAYSEHAVESFELDAIDYLLKPFSMHRFLKACNKANEQYDLRNSSSPASAQTVFIKSGYEQIRVALDEILYAESNGNYVEFVMRDKKFLSRLTMSEAGALLPSAFFMRIHRSFIVAKNQITKIDKNNVWIGKTPLPIGSLYYDDVMELAK